MERIVYTYEKFPARYLSKDRIVARMTSSTHTPRLDNRLIVECPTAVVHSIEEITHNSGMFTRIWDVCIVNVPAVAFIPTPVEFETVVRRLLNSLELKLVSVSHVWWSIWRLTELLYLIARLVHECKLSLGWVRIGVRVSRVRSRLLRREEHTLMTRLGHHHWIWIRRASRRCMRSAAASELTVVAETRSSWLSVPPSMTKIVA